MRPWISGMAVLAVLGSTVSRPPPSFSVTEIPPYRAYTTSEAVFVDRVPSGETVVVGTYGSSSLPDRAFLWIQRGDGGTAPEPLLIHEDDPFEATRAVTALHSSGEILVGGTSRPDDGRHASVGRTWTAVFVPGRAPYVGHGERLNTNSADGYRAATAVTGIARFPNPDEANRRFIPHWVCWVGTLVGADKKSGILLLTYERSFKAAFSPGSADGDSVRALATLGERCLAVGRYQGSAVEFDLARLPPNTLEEPLRLIGPSMFTKIGPRRSEALGISSFGDVVGWAEGEGPGSELPMLLIRGVDSELRPLPLPDGWRAARSVASTRSARGLVSVGWGVDPRGQRRALLWIGRDQVSPLDELLVVKEPGWALEEASWVDEQLDIVGTGLLGGRKRGFLLRGIAR